MIELHNYHGGNPIHIRGTAIISVAAVAGAYPFTSICLEGGHEVHIIESVAQVLDSMRLWNSNAATPWNSFP